MKNPVILSIDFDFFVREIPVLDWGFSEEISQELLALIWGARMFGTSDDILNALVPSSGPCSPGFWGALRDLGFSMIDALAFFSDSHEVGGRQVFECLDKTERYDIFHFDAHHDMGYKGNLKGFIENQGPISCEDWLLAYPAVSRRIDTIHVVYPEWRREPCPITGLPVSEIDSDMGLDTQRTILGVIGTMVEIDYWGDLVPEARDVDFICVSRSPPWVPPWMDGEFESLMDNCPGYELHHSFGPQGDKLFQMRQAVSCSS